MPDIQELYTLGIDIGSTTVKIAVLDHANNILFAEYERHYANIQETLRSRVLAGPGEYPPLRTAEPDFASETHQDRTRKKSLL